MMNANNQAASDRRLVVEVRGVVQGVGFRPFVFGLARRLNLGGSVRNEADIVRIEARGPAAALDVFLRLLRSEAPAQAKIDTIDVFEAECLEQTGAALSDAAFEILASAEGSSPRPTIPADLATCPDCLAEIRDSGRRHGYAFTNCTHCGPRWSIISGLPYDRPRTSMAPFAMCRDCRGEYDDPTDRRFHAQPIACSACGPKPRLLDPGGQLIAETDRAISAAAEMVRGGRIVAIKGLGGFQLVVDAASPAAVARLRARKHRPHKPLAVMAASVAEAKLYCDISDEERRLLESAATPIVLLRKKTANSEIAEGVAPGNPFLGIMLPCTPLHHILLASIGRAIVCTSGNISEEPMAITTTEAVARLGTIADGLLVHNRAIVRPVDDSVARINGTAVQILRRGRGYAPLPIEIRLAEDDDSPAATMPTVLAVGGHLKNTVALKLGRQVVVGSHVGDLDNIESVDVHRRAIDDLLGFFRVKPDVVACDMHPDYASTRHAETLAQRWRVPLVRVQHHHAHVAACIAEHGLRGPVLGLAWDGSGYGEDKTVWGGEALLCLDEKMGPQNDSILCLDEKMGSQNDSILCLDEKMGSQNDSILCLDGKTSSQNGSMGFTRVAHLRTFGLPGGDRAVRRPRRSALGALFEFDADEAARRGSSWFEAAQLSPLLTMLERGTHCPRTSSMGRLFDAVAALCGLPKTGGGPMSEISFEGQAAMALEFAAENALADAYEFPLSDGRPAVADWAPALRGVIADLTDGVSVGVISTRFHNGLAELALSIARRAGCSQVVLSGGCFQNGFLSSRVGARLSQAGFNVFTHEMVPAGDGGISLGQAFIAARQH